MAGTPTNNYNDVTTLGLTWGSGYIPVAQETTLGGIMTTMTGADLRAIREGRGLSQPAFASMLNGLAGTKYDKTVISKWENDKVAVPAEIALRLMDLASSAPVGIPAKIGPAVVTACSNQKGGVGKTMAAVNLSYALAKAGKRVLLVDCDPQGDAAIHLGLDPSELEEQGKTLTHVLGKEMPAEAAIVPVCDSLFDLLASSIILAEVEISLMIDPAGNLALREKLSEVADRYDHIILDCPPNLGMLTASALNASDRVLIPSQTQMLAVMGLTLLVSTIAKIRRRVNPKLTILGVLPTQVHQRNNQDRAMIDALEHAAAQHNLRLFPHVKYSSAFPTSVTEGQPVLAGRSPIGAEAFAEVVEALVDVESRAKEAAHG